MKETEGYFKHISLSGIKFQLKSSFSLINRELRELCLMAADFLDDCLHMKPLRICIPLNS